jgi:2-amino-4-hydroxy-6-hydroxymethyldihydropteridine diphosphokinase
MEITEALFLSLGSNLGDRKQKIESAYALIEKTIGPILKKSSYFENIAVGFESDDLFLNSCIQVRTDKTPDEVLQAIKTIENQLGRTQRQPNEAYKSRQIDIDIILWGDLVFEHEKLTIPHFNFRERLFALVPLTEIAPNVIDPVSQLTVKQLLNLL